MAGEELETGLLLLSQRFHPRYMRGKRVRGEARHRSSQELAWAGKRVDGQWSGKRLARRDATKTKVSEYDMHREASHGSCQSSAGREMK